MKSSEPIRGASKAAAMKKLRQTERHYFKDRKKPATRARIERKARKHRSRLERG